MKLLCRLFGHRYIAVPADSISMEAKPGELLQYRVNLNIQCSRCHTRTITGKRFTIHCKMGA